MRNNKKRLIQSNHVSPEMHIFNEYMVTTDSPIANSTKMYSDYDYNLAKTIVNHLPTAPNNQLILKVYDDIKNGYYNEVPEEEYVDFTIYLLREQGILFDYDPSKSTLEYRLYGGEKE